MKTPSASWIAKTLAALCVVTCSVSAQFPPDGPEGDFGPPPGFGGPGGPGGRDRDRGPDLGRTRAAAGASACTAEIAA